MTIEKIYWDSDAFLGWLQNEPGKVDLCRAPLSEIGMVKSVEITNFRGFEALKVSNLARINVIVGDNAVGKTALLEAIFFALCSSPDKALALRQWRGLNITFQAGSGDSLVEGIYSDLFHDPDSTVPATIKLTGREFENRELEIAKTRGDVVIPTKDARPASKSRPRKQSKRKPITQEAETDTSITAPIRLTWKDQHGTKNGALYTLHTTIVSLYWIQETNSASYGHVDPFKKALPQRKSRFRILGADTLAGRPALPALRFA